MDGERLGGRVSATTPTLAEVAGLGEHRETNYVVVGRDGDDVVTLYGRGGGSSWSVIAADVDLETAEEVRLWFELTQHYGGEASAGSHPLGHVPTPDRGRIASARAISLVADWIRLRGLEYPTLGLKADRFEAGWSVYAPVDIDESDPMAFLALPVGRSVFMVSDLGRVKEVPSSIPPPQAEEMFTAEEAIFAARPLRKRSWSTSGTR
ncbi:hypothetical protein PV415_22775 [Streptomyces sp. ME03-5684b]|uniref:hypothetical protein n=1 Tax=Streptomyces sp. ME03-5684b TaxID=3028681 RepID=UPI0029BAD35D|nr:hypothetical protein [Streptomyces sp. ME03-5684b]MDX3319735.1 hypothetical protein [Streptomyces sp. ME03-5684b]